MQSEVKQMSRTIEVRLPDDLLQRIDQRVRQKGSDRSHAIQELIEKGLKEEEPPHAGMTFAELLTRASGPSPADAMTDEELAGFSEAEVKAHRAQRRRAVPNGG
jgi:predicted DNA-binding protein